MHSAEAECKPVRLLILNRKLDSKYAKSLPLNEENKTQVQNYKSVIA